MARRPKNDVLLESISRVPLKAQTLGHEVSLADLETRLNEQGQQCCGNRALPNEIRQYVRLGPVGLQSNQQIQGFHLSG